MGFFPLLHGGRVGEKSTLIKRDIESFLFEKMQRLFFFQADWESKEGVLADDWPSKGAVEVSDLEVKYREDLKPALKDISCTLNPSEKVSVRLLGNTPQT